MDRLLGGLRAAAEPTRLRVLALCAHAELTVTDLTQKVLQAGRWIERGGNQLHAQDGSRLAAMVGKPWTGLSATSTEVATCGRVNCYC